MTVKPGHLPAEAEAVLDAELDRLGRTPPTDVELRRAKRNIEARLYRGIERLNGNGSRADILNAMQMWRGDPGFVNQLVARYRAVTPAQVQEPRGGSSPPTLAWCSSSTRRRPHGLGPVRTHAMDRIGRLALLAPPSSSPAPPPPRLPPARRRPLHPAPTARCPRRAPRTLRSGRRSPSPGRR